MTTRRITPSFVAGCVAGAVVAGLFTWAAVSWSLRLEKQRVVLAASMPRPCAEAGRLSYQISTMLDVVERCDEGDAQGARDFALQMARLSMSALGPHRDEMSSMYGVCEARIHQALQRSADADVDEGSDQDPDEDVDAGR